MKKTNTLKGVNSMPAGTRIVTYICLAWALIVSLLPIGWLVLSSLKKDPMARPGFQLPESICLDGYISTFKDLHVMRYFLAPLSHEESNEQANKIQSHILEKDWGFWAVELKATDQFIGFVGLHCQTSHLNELC